MMSPTICDVPKATPIFDHGGSGWRPLVADSVAKVEKLKVPKIDAKAAATRKHCSKAL
jgi:hypothetical protein